jgi:hypothetical protein
MVQPPGFDRRSRNFGREMGRATAPCVRDARPEGWDRGGPPRTVTPAEAKHGRAAVGPARLGTVVSCPTARAARFGVSAPNTPKPAALPFPTADANASADGTRYFTKNRRSAR